jgi:hypothetical protein
MDVSESSVLEQVWNQLWVFLSEANTAVFREPGAVSSDQWEEPFRPLWSRFI